MVQVVSGAQPITVDRGQMRHCDWPSSCQVPSPQPIIMAGGGGSDKAAKALLTVVVIREEQESGVRGRLGPRAAGVHPALPPPGAPASGVRRKPFRPPRGNCCTRAVGRAQTPAGGRHREGRPARRREAQWRGCARSLFSADPTSLRGLLRRGRLFLRAQPLTWPGPGFGDKNALSLEPQPQPRPASGPPSRGPHVLGTASNSVHHGAIALPLFSIIFPLLSSFAILVFLLFKPR